MDNRKLGPHDGAFWVMSWYEDLRPSYEARLCLPHFESQIGRDTDLVMDIYASRMTAGHLPSISKRRALGMSIIRRKAHPRKHRTIFVVVSNYG